jgi:ATP-dependent exoDNAse (exonuclease V) alpha subunit
MPTPEQISEALAMAAAKIAMAKARLSARNEQEERDRIARLGLKIASAVPHAPIAKAISSIQWNAKQQEAIDNAYYGKSFCLIGAAGTGKTTTLRAILQNLIENHRIPPLHADTKSLRAGAPGVALISYTRRAVRNIAKQMPDNLKPHCLTYHKLMEYEPVFYEEWDEERGEEVKRMKFEPARNKYNPLPYTLVLIVVDESSMLSTDYFNLLRAGLPDSSQVQFIFLGDLNQLPPVYGNAVLGQKLLELPIIELTEVYRQALESPIIACALSVKDNSFDGFKKDAIMLWGAPAGFDPRNVTQVTTLVREGRGKVTLHPWKKELDKDDALYAMQGQLKLWMKDGTYDPEQDLVLCPWNKSFGSTELNLAIADHLAKSKGLLVHEVIAGFNKFYFAVGDKLLIDKSEAIILDISRNPKYLGKLPQPASKELNRWGVGGTGTNAHLFDESLDGDNDVDAMLEHAADVEDRTADASHQIKVLFTDTGEEQTITKSATLNATTFAYAITVHKAQGSECRRVFLLTHQCHAAMCSRELIYTAITRAAEELYIVMPPKMLAKAASKPRIKGDTLAAKLEFFQTRLGEKDE